MTNPRRRMPMMERRIPLRRLVAMTSAINSGLGE
jgi:hypothetical protein